MTDQDSGDTATGKAKHVNLGQRLSPFLDVFGAVLIFGSWLFSNTFAQRAQEQAQMHQAIISRVRQFRIYDDFARRISDIQSDLGRTRNLAEREARRGDATNNKPLAPLDTPKWTGMTPTQVRETDDFAEDLGGYAAELTIPETLVQQVQTARSRSKELLRGFVSARDEYEQIIAKLENSSSATKDDLVAQEELRQQIDALWQDHYSTKQEMLQLGDQLLETADAQAASAGQLATTSKRLSHVCYVIGTLIILYGRAMRVLAVKKSEVAKTDDETTDDEGKDAATGHAVPGDGKRSSA